jgi:DNA repair protein RecN (Recombination protein N)
VTTSDTTIVDGEARVVEVARMLGGDADREISRAHARELLERGGEESAIDTASTTARGRGTQRRGKPV